MPPKQNNSSLAQVKVVIEISEFVNAPKQNPPFLFLQFPNQQPIQVDLLEAGSRPVSAKKDTKKKDPKKTAESEETIKPIVYRSSIALTVDILNPIEMQQIFLTNQLKLYLDDPALKQKVPPNPQTFDLTPLLVSLPIREQKLLCSFNDFTVHFSMHLQLISAVHGNEVLVPLSFLPQNLSSTPLILQVMTVAKMPQNQDSSWRARYLQPVSVRCTMFGQQFTSQPISQVNFGDSVYSVETPVRLNCSLLCKTPSEILSLYNKLDEQMITVEVFSRLPKADRVPSGKDKVKDPKAKEAVKAPSSQCLEFKAVAQFSARELLQEARVIDKYFTLKPDAKLLGNAAVPSFQQIVDQQKARVPAFPVAPAPVVDAKGKVANQEVLVPKTDFEEFQKQAETQPLGDWSQSAIRVRAAVSKPLIQYISSKEGQKEAARPRSTKKEKAPEGALFDPAAKQHFERMYIYLSKSPEQTKILLSIVGRLNVVFLQNFAVPRVKAQFPQGAETEIDEYASLLSTLTLQQALSDEIKSGAGKRQKSAKSDQGSSDDSLHNLAHPAITGFRFADNNGQLMFLEAPAAFNLLKEIREVAVQMPGCVIKIGPTVYFRKRSFPQSPLLLRHFALSKPIVELGLIHDQTYKFLTPLFQLFDIDASRAQPIQAPIIDLRQMREAGLFMNAQQLDDIVKYYGGNIPKALNLNSLFQPAVEPVIMNSSAAEIESSQAASVTSSQLRNIEASGAKMSGFIHRAVIKHRPIKQFERPGIPEELVTQQRALSKQQSSAGRIPKFQVKKHDNLIDAQIESSHAAMLEVNVAQVARDIYNTSNLRTDTTIKAALTGKAVFQYSQQTLNQQRLQNRVAAKVLNGTAKVLKTKADLEVPHHDRDSAVYRCERGWK